MLLQNIQSMYTQLYLFCQIKNTNYKWFGVKQVQQITLIYNEKIYFNKNKKVQQFQPFLNKVNTDL